jgi:hypothetical protein
MNRDIENRKDIEQLINAFYDKVREDELIGFIFNDVAKVNWQKHLPVMYDCSKCARTCIEHCSNANQNNFTIYIF